METYNAMFGQHPTDHGVYPNNLHVIQSQNWDEILGVVERPR